MKKVLLCFLIHINGLLAQSSNLDSIKYFLFESVDNTPFHDSLLAFGESVVINARYNDSDRKKFNENGPIQFKFGYDTKYIESPNRADLIEYYCSKIRDNKDTTDISPLTQIIYTQDSLFNKEWGRAYKTKYFGLFDEQYSIMLILEITRLSLILQNYSASEKYSFLINLYYRQFINKDDHDNIGPTPFISKSVNTWKGQCNGSSYCVMSLIEELASEIVEVAFASMRNLPMESLSAREKYFYQVSLFDALLKSENEKFEFYLFEFLKSDFNSNILIDSYYFNNLIYFNLPGRFEELQRQVDILKQNRQQSNVIIQQLEYTFDLKRNMLFERMELIRVSLLSDALSEKPKGFNTAKWFGMLYNESVIWRKLSVEFFLYSLSAKKTNLKHLSNFMIILNSKDQMRVMKNLKKMNKRNYKQLTKIL